MEEEEKLKHSYQEMLVQHVFIQFLCTMLSYLYTFYTSLKLLSFTMQRLKCSSDVVEWRVNVLPIELHNRKGKEEKHAHKARLLVDAIPSFPHDQHVSSHANKQTKHS